MPGKQTYTSYHSVLLAPAALRLKVHEIAAKVTEIKQAVPFEAIAVRGVSGLGMGAAVSYETGIPLVIVRKPGEQSHGNQVEGPGLIAKFLVLDDIISSGETMRTIIGALNPAECVGVLLYSDSFGLASNHGVPFPVWGLHDKIVAKQPVTPRPEDDIPF